MQIVAFLPNDDDNASQAKAQPSAGAPALLTVAINNRYSTSSYEASDEAEPSTDDSSDNDNDDDYLSPSDDTTATATAASDDLIDSTVVTR